MVRSALTALVAAVLIGAAVAWSAYGSFLKAPLALPVGGVLFELAPGSSFRAMVEKLDAGGYTRADWRWRLLGRLDSRARQLQAGEYRLEPGISPLALVEQLARGEVHLYALTIVEGWRYTDLRRALAEAPAVRRTLEDVDDESLMAQLGAPGVSPEGRFLPETYRYPRGTTDRQLLAQAYDAMAAALDRAWEERDEGLPYRSPDEVLTMASIIEKETAVAEERAQIAGVFVRRLQRGMRLQTDPTVIYGLGDDFDGNLRRRDLRRDTPWNTYTRKGLPPTPIALPGADALTAAVHPEPGDALYFVARGDGTHAFSATLEAHEAAVDRYQRRMH